MKSKDFLLNWVTFKVHCLLYEVRHQPIMYPLCALYLATDNNLDIIQKQCQGIIAL